MDRNASPARRFLAQGIVSLGLTLLAAGVSAGAAAATPPDAKALIDALEDRGIEAVSQLVREGANINASKPGDGTVLMVASRRADLAAVDRLIALGAAVHATARADATALIAAAGAGHLSVVKRLLTVGARIDDIVSGDETALISASRKGHLHVVRHLVEQKADVNLGVATPTGLWRTPLNQARTPAIRTYLQQQGALDRRP